MAMYSKRDCGYKVGMLIFCVGVIAFATGFATPHWAKYEIPLRLLSASSAGLTQVNGDLVVKGHTGLWTYCTDLPDSVSSESDCDDVSSSSPGWMTAVKVVDCSAVGVMGLTLLFFFFTNCVARKAAFTRLLEVGACISGLLGLAGAGVYIWKNYTEDEIATIRWDTPDINKALSWSFYLNAGGSIIILLATIPIALYNTPIKPKRVTTQNCGTRPTAPYPTLDRRHGATAAGLEQGYRPSGSNPYVISAAMTSQAPKLYPSLQEVDENSN